MPINKNTDVDATDAIQTVHFRRAISRATQNPYSALILTFENGLEKMVILESAEAVLLGQMYPAAK